MADQSVFIRVFSLLRHLLQKPFDHERGTPLTEQLIRSLDGIYMPGESATLRKDIERILTPMASEPATTTCAMAMALVALCFLLHA